MTTTAKRPLDAAAAPISGRDTTNASSKRRPNPSSTSIPVPPGHTALRLLCRTPIIGGVIGRSGSIISLLRQETGAKIHVEDAVPSSDERVVLMVAPDSPTKTVYLGGPLEVSAAQEALLRVFDRTLEVEDEVGAAGEVSKTARLLVPTAKVGPIMGKGGKKIEKIRREAGVKIRILPKEQLPACATTDDELIQIMGDAISVKKALVAVSCYLKDNPTSDQLQVVSKAQRVVPQRIVSDTYKEFPSQRSSLLPPAPVSYTGYASSGHDLPTRTDRLSLMDQEKTLQEVSFRILCSNEKVGGVIGKGGTIVRALQNETGASISIGVPVDESEERIITISATESPNLAFSRAQNAVLRVFRRSVEVGNEKGPESGLDKGSSVTARLLVRTNQIGCLMGRGGAIIQEMRRLSGADIRVIEHDLIPKCASKNEDVVQISGELSNVQDALIHATSRLRDNFFPAQTLNGSGMGVHTSPHHGRTSYERVGPTSPRSSYPFVGLPPSLDRQATLAHNMDYSGLSNNIQPPPSPRLWVPQMISGGNPMTISDSRSSLTTIKSGIEPGSRSKSTIVTNTTVDILVPESAFGMVYGENGSNLSRIRQVSGANVVVHDPHPSQGGGRVVISGTPNQTQTAQSLLHAFILSGQPSAGHLS